MGDEGGLTLTVRIGVSPEPEVVELLKRYRTALNLAVRILIENRATSIGKAHRLLYSYLKSTFNLPSRIVNVCYREALSIAKSWLRNPNRGKMPTIKTLRMWLTPKDGYRIRDGYVELAGGYRLKIIGWDRRYDQFENREARLVYRNGKMYLMVAKRIPKPAEHEPKGVLAVDINEREVVIGNHEFEKRIETPIDRAIHFTLLAERLQKKYSEGRYRPWLNRNGIRRRISSFHRKAMNIIEDWVRKTALEIVRTAKLRQLAIAREDLNGLVKAVRKLPKTHRRRLIMLGYTRLIHWIDWEAEKHGAPIVVVEPRGTSSTCPRCSTKLIETGYRRLGCPKCGFESNRDSIAILNIEKKALAQVGGPLAAPTAPQMTDVAPNRWGEPMNRPKGTPAL